MLFTLYSLSVYTVYILVAGVHLLPNSAFSVNIINTRDMRRYTIHTIKKKKTKAQ